VSDTIIIIDVSDELPTEYDWSSSDAIAVVPQDSLPNTIIGPDGKTYPEERFVGIIVPEEGLYTVTQRSIRGDCFVSVQKEINVTYKDSGVENPYSLSLEVKSLKVFPSPVEQGEDVVIRFTTTDKEPVEVSLINLSGQVMYSEIYLGKKRYSLNLKTDGLIEGTYILKLKTKTSILTARILIN